MERRGRLLVALAVLIAVMATSVYALITREAMPQIGRALPPLATRQAAGPSPAPTVLPRTTLVPGVPAGEPPAQRGSPGHPAGSSALPPPAPPNPQPVPPPPPPFSQGGPTAALAEPAASTTPAPPSATSAPTGSPPAPTVAPTQNGSPPAPTVAPAPTPSPPASPIPVVQAGIPLRLRIPALGIATTVESVGLVKGAMDVPANVWDVAWYKLGPRPGEAGNAVIDGHKDSATGPAIFLYLRNLHIGDYIYVRDDRGIDHAFAVTEMDSYDLATAPLMRIFGPTDEHHLNLITCSGSWDYQKHIYGQRLVVYTRLVTAT